MILIINSDHHFHQCFQEWVGTVYEKISREVVALDGKTVRRTKCESNGKKAIHVVSAWANKNKLVLGQIKVDDKSNEITAIPEMPEFPEMEDSAQIDYDSTEACLISID